MGRLFNTLAIAIFALNAPQALADCPFDVVARDTVSGPLNNVPLRANLKFPAVLFETGLEVDYDGAPDAYHIGNTDDSADPGLDHICNGGSVLEFKDGKLVDKYGKNGSIGSLGGVDPVSGVGRSKLCKRDYIAIRDNGFPKCGPENLCMLFYGIKAEPRKCGYDNPFDGIHDTRCGAPMIQRDEGDEPRPYYLTTTALHHPKMKVNSQRQKDFADASKIPFIVMPGRQQLPGGMKYAVGDIAVVVRGNHVSYAVVGDIGPRGKIGEASAALLWQLSAKGPVEYGKKPAVMTVLLPGTAGLLNGQWPIDPANVREVARKQLTKLSFSEMRKCPGLERLR